MKKNSIQTQTSLPLDNVAVQQSLSLDEKLKFKDEWLKESVTKFPDGTVQATRELRHSEFEYGNTQMAATSVVALPSVSASMPRQKLARLLPVGGAMRATVDWRSVARWALSAKVLALWGLGGGLDWRSLVSLAFSEPLSLVHSAATVAAMLAAQYRLNRQGGGGRIATGLWAGTIGIALLPLTPLADSLEVPTQILRWFGLPVLSAWAFLPLVQRGRDAVRRLSESPRSLPEPAQSTPRISISTALQSGRALDVLLAITRGAASLVPRSTIFASAPKTESARSAIQGTCPTVLPAGNATKPLPSPASKPLPAAHPVRTRVR